MVGSDGNNAVGALDDGHIGVRNGSTHHGAAHFEHHIVTGYTAAVIDDLLDIGAQLYHVVAGITDKFAGDGDNTLHQRHTLLDGVRDGLGGRGVAHHAAHISRQLSAGNLAAHDLLNEHLLSTLGVLGFGCADADILIWSNLFFHQRDGIGLVVLNEDHALRGTDCLHHGPQTKHDIIGIFQHHPMVGSQVGLALGTVDKYSVNGLSGLQFDIGGEGGAAHTNDTLFLDDLNDLVRGQLFQRLIGHHGFMKRVLAVIFDDHTHYTGPLIGMGMGFHCNDRAADTGMHRSADKSCLLADKLTNFHGIARLNHGIRRGANVHRQRDDHGVRLGEFLQRQMLGVLLVLCRMDTAVEALVTLGAGLGHISLDLIHIGHGVVPQLNGLIQKLPGSPLLFQTLVNLFPGTVLFGIDFAFAVLSTAALTVDQTLGAVHNGTDAAGDVQITLGTGAAGFLGQGHAVMTDVVQGIRCRKDGNGCQIRHSLHAQTARNDHHILGSFRHNTSQLLFGLDLVAQEVYLCGSGNVLSLRLRNGSKVTAFRLFGCVELLVALVAGNHKEVVFSC